MNKSKIGLSLPVFCGSLFSFFLGAPVLGLIGVWGFLYEKQAVPQFLKVLHAHVTWWSIVILIVSLLLPGLMLKRWFRRCIIIGSFVAFPVYVISMATHYTLIDPTVISLSTLGSFFVSPWGMTSFIIEVSFFLTAFLTALMSVGVSVPFLEDKNATPSKFDLQSDISVSAKTVVGYTGFLAVAVILGLYMLGRFTLQHLPVSPSAFVQFHTHIGIFSLSFFMTILAMNAFGAREKIIKMTESIGLTALATTVVGFLMFIYLDMPSVVWVVPAMLFFAVLCMGWLTTLGIFGLKPKGNHFHFIRIASMVIWLALLVFTLAGPYLALKYDTSNNVTVSYKQSAGHPYVGEYPNPVEYPGSAPNPGTPRGIENFHLSPAGWSHVAIFWLIIILIFGSRILGGIGAPNMIFFLSTIIPMAPIINSIGRVGAWAGLSFGIGPLYLVAHPLKTLNVILLIIITIIWMKKVKNGTLKPTADSDVIIPNISS